MKSMMDKDGKKDELAARTKTFALRVIKLAESLSNSGTGRVIKDQILRAGTSVGANYRAARRAELSPAI